jgi:hypothetical protein
MPTPWQKSDHTHLKAKLDLRRYFLRKYHRRGAIRVLDCCQGDGVLWARLRREFTLASYWGLDVKPKRARLKVDSMRVLAQSGWSENVIDVDTYGSPWGHWLALLPNVKRPTTVFLTDGRLQAGTDGRLLEALGIGRLKVPPGIGCRLRAIGARALVCQAAARGLRILEAQEASGGAMHYIGVHLRSS